MSADCPSDKELLPAISHTIDAQGRLLTVTNRWLSKLGYCRDEVIGKRSIEFFTPETRSRILCAEVPAFFERGFQDDALIPGARLVAAAHLATLAASGYAIASY